MSSVTWFLEYVLPREFVSHTSYPASERTNAENGQTTLVYRWYSIYYYYYFYVIIIINIKFAHHSDGKPVRGCPLSLYLTAKSTNTNNIFNTRIVCVCVGRGCAGGYQASLLIFKPFQFTPSNFSKRIAKNKTEQERLYITFLIKVNCN